MRLRWLMMMLAVLGAVAWGAGAQSDIITVTGTLANDGQNDYNRYVLETLNPGDVIYAVVAVNEGDIALYTRVLNSSSPESLIVETGSELAYVVSDPDFYVLDVGIASGNAGAYTLTYAINNPDVLGIGDEPTPAPDLVTPVDMRERLQFEGYADCIIIAPPADLDVDPFYQKYCDLVGIPILASANVQDMALRQAWRSAAYLLQANPEVAVKLVENGVRIVIIANEEDLIDIPEYSGFDETFPDVDWSKAMRGLSATPELPIVSAGEENLLCYGIGGDPHWGEDIFVREFALTYKDMGLNLTSNNLQMPLQTSFLNAAQAEIWNNTQAGASLDAYWAEGVQSYFNANRESRFPDGVHNYVNTRDELAGYDIPLYTLIDALFNSVRWRPACPCALVANSAAKLRNGPGTEYDQIGVLTTGQTAYALGQARDVGNFIWFELENGIWVRIDVVDLPDNTNCLQLPITG